MDCVQKFKNPKKGRGFLCDHCTKMSTLTLAMSKICI